MNTELTPELEKALYDLVKAQARAKKYEEKFQALKRAEINKVKIFENLASLSLEFNGRKINARKNRYNRFRVAENGRILKSDYSGSLDNLRFDIAMGRI